MKLFHLNMWQRIGVVASVIWIVVAGVKRRLEIVDTASLVARMDRDTCVEQKQPGLDCEAVRSKAFEEYFSSGWDDVAATAFMPVVLGWIVAYAVLFTVRWILAGRKAA